jgi:hypothetical protein
MLIALWLQGRDEVAFSLVSIPLASMPLQYFAIALMDALLLSQAITTAFTNIKRPVAIKEPIDIKSIFCAYVHVKQSSSFAQPADGLIALFLNDRIESGGAAPSGSILDR